MEDGLVLCHVKSWITGRRLVSLPFSDHCEPLLNGAANEQAFLSALESAVLREKFRYCEIRPLHSLGGTTDLQRSVQTYCLHQLDLRPDLDTLFGNCHKSSTQRKILRADKEALVYQSGRSEALLEAYWDLLLMTRRKHRVPPQPKSWFRNLIACFGEALQIRVAFKDNRPVASILTIRHKDTLVYKYGCSDPRFNKLGGTQLLFWKTIVESKLEGLHTFDLGRTDCDNAGLLRFKDGWGSFRSDLVYSRFTATTPPRRSRLLADEWITRTAKRVVPYLPSFLLRMAGTVLYRHIA